MEISFLFATDLHGDMLRLDALLKFGRSKGKPAIILGGDLFRAGKGNDTDSQMELLSGQVEPRVSTYPGDVYTIFGNNDWKVVSDHLDEYAPSILSIQGT